MKHAEPDAMARLHAQCFTTPPPWSAAAFAAQIAAPHTILIATKAGFALGHALAGEAELLTMAVAPAQRRCGHGRELLSAILQAARARGAEAIYLEVAVENTPARALYARAGFVEAGRREGYYRTPHGQTMDAVILRRALKDLPSARTPPDKTG